LLFFDYTAFLKHATKLLTLQCASLRGFEIWRPEAAVRLGDAIASLDVVHHQVGLGLGSRLGIRLGYVHVARQRVLK
jgi:hypothetical protein